MKLPSVFPVSKALIILMPFVSCSYISCRSYLIPELIQRSALSQFIYEMHPLRRFTKRKMKSSMALILWHQKPTM